MFKLFLSRDLGCRVVEYFFLMSYGCMSSHSKNVNGLMSFPIIHSAVSLHVSIIIIWKRRKQNIRHEVTEQSSAVTTLHYHIRN